MFRITGSSSLPASVSTPDILSPRTSSDTAAVFPGLITDRQTVISQTGIAAEHLAPLQALAEEQQLVISFRPVEATATGLISAGYPTKNFNIKGKSANWGPMAGFIPVNQFYSKLCGEKHKIELMNKKVAECLRDGHATANILQITGSRINELVDMGLLTRHHPDKNGFITLEAKSPHNDTHKFTAKPAADDLYSIYVQEDDTPIQVLCFPQLNKPLTADYDLMIVAPRTEDFGSQDIPHNPDVSADAFAEKRPYLLRRGSTKETIRRELLEREDPRLGNNTPRIAALIPLINASLFREDGKEVVHHSMDATNPFSDMSANFPVTFFLPEPLDGLPKTLLVNNIEGLRTMLHTLECNDFMVPHNPLWSDEIPSLRRESFEMTRKLFNTL
ncbi:CyaA/EF/ExoY family adenylyl cyclase toxin [Morganella morganii]|uniref:CyaA/EF/ExoY family adenylyl cyclase toxin n=1 Tax=Morganella morganii TaxID=582 RepID=A0AAI9HN85_MORMO|nr:CyaA/EF/ExoY family adenylyl cyclase toxin [Morganella morganii]